MLNFLCKTVLNGTHCTIRAASAAPKSLSSSRHISSTSNQHSFTVSYLMNSCGLSRDTALSASQHVNFETPDKADLVIGFFKNHGFSESQISTVIERVPPVLLADPEKTLLPKLEFLHSKGFTSPEIVGVVSRNPPILERSLKKQIVPSFVFFRNLLGTDVEAATAVKRFSGILSADLNTFVANIDIMRENGVPETNIVKFIKEHPRVFMTDPVRFKRTVEEVKEMGFNASNVKFVEAIYAMTGMSKSTWERKVNTYKRWGLSEAEIIVAFKKHPSYILASADKIERAMDFFVNKMGWECSLIVERPILVLLSLEKRIVPRTSVIKDLVSRGLVKKDIYLPTVFEYQEKKFLEKFVTPYMEASELLKLYEEEVDLSEVGREWNLLGKE
ncbi:uncharacterized protein LOC122319008 [Carya illinoinensis]|uniref:Uncharacterized protein n=1 Tax=Carya illinoinensis TaxID=32201 RepID=A0A8T1RN59_CARIL|nr:uncharacterized protein LOC122319008 [Carya illinoinensis]KAG6668149.1 hypothetical protein CIPAW_01G150800 [Carya illinoinensis]